MLKVIELFGGIGACTSALKRLNIDFEIVDYVEIDKYAVKSYNAINDTNFEPQDITKWDKDLDVDFIMHRSPCQDFSVAGKQAGGDEGSGTRSSLMYETIRIVESLHPKYVVWENVKNLLSKKHRHNFDAYLEELNQLGYNNYYQVLNAKDYGIPQNRERVYTISIRKDIDNGTFTFPEKEELKLRLKDMLEDEVDEKYYLSDKIVEKITYSNFAQEKARLQEKEYCDTLLARDYKDPKCIEVNRKYGVFDLEEKLPVGNGGGVEKDIVNPLKYKTPYGWHFEQNVYSEDSKCCRTVKSSGGSGNIPKAILGLRIRKLTPKECWRLMGFSDEEFEKAEKVNSNTQLYKQAGNSIVVDVLCKILRGLNL